MTAHEVIIVPIAEEDIPGFHAALDYVAKERKYLLFLEAPPFDSAREFVLNNIKEDYPQFVARVDGKVAGWCDIMPAKNREITQHVGVLGIGLLPAVRGQGIGRRLMLAAIEKAKKQGLTRIELTVREKNENAIALYKKIGFEMEGLKRNATRTDGVYENIYMMALLV